MNLCFKLDRPLTFRYEGKTGELSVEAYSQSLQEQTGGNLSVLRLELTPEAVQALAFLLEAIQANPGKDIEGTSSEPNTQ